MRVHAQTASEHKKTQNGRAMFILDAQFFVDALYRDGELQGKANNRIEHTAQ
jgi:hypothetical protein